MTSIVLKKAPKRLENLKTENRAGVSPNPRGGVSPRLNMPAARGLKSLTEQRAGAVPAAAFPNFSFHGGPVISSPQVYSSFWGNQWLTDPTHRTRADRLSQFLQDLLESGYMNVLSQYGVGSGAGSAGAFIRSSFISSVPTTLTDKAIQGIIQNSIDAGVLPEPGSPSNVALVIYLDDTIGVNDLQADLVLCEPTGDDAFGFHSFFTTTAGNPFYYAIIPGLTDTCLTESCSTDATCSLHLAEQQEQRQTQVTSHEFAEMTTDPELNAWFDPVASENGDICNGEAATLTVGANSWIVQRQYSKTDDINSNGATFCVVEAPAPLPKLSPGPTSPLTVSSEMVAQLNALKVMLPFPPVSFDLETKEVSMNEEDVQSHVRKMFAPFKPTALLPGLPDLLRSMAEIMENAS